MHTTLRTLLNEKGRDTYCAEPSMTVTDCIALMNSKKIGALPVLDTNKKIVGMFTERDVLAKLFSGKVDIATAKVADVMTKDVITVGPEAKVTEAMQIVNDRRFRHLPVLDNDKLVGLISSGDLNHWLLEAQANHIDHLEGYIQGDGY